MATSVDVANMCGTDQLCSRLKAAIKGVVHTMNDLLRRIQEQEGACCWWMPIMHLTH